MDRRSQVSRRSINRILTSNMHCFPADTASYLPKYRPTYIRDLCSLPHLYLRTPLKVIC